MPRTGRSRARLAVVALAASALLVPPAAQAGGNGNQGGKHDFVVGSTKRALFDPPNQDIRVSVAAFSGPLGENPFGHVHFRNYTTKTQTHGVVRCLRVTGNTASVGVEITRSDTPGYNAGDGVIWFFTDRGRPGKEEDLDATFSTPPNADPDPTNCPPPPPPFTRPTKSGNYVIRDVNP
jgi:hypothetical protein